MAVIIGSARHDENGKVVGGKAGDQTGHEVETQDWYLHAKGWVCIRAKDPEDREMIALDMEYICENPNIGYDQSQNTTLYQAAKPYAFNAAKVLVPCETDCARAVRVCVLYAGIICEDFYTGSEVEALRRTGKFDILTEDKYTKTSDYLLRGDILVTKKKGHTVVVLTDGAKAKEKPPVEHKTLRRGDKGPEVKEMQTDLRELGFAMVSGKEMVADGSFGAITKATVVAFQTLTGLKADAVCGPKTWGKIDELLEMEPTETVALTDVYYRIGPGPNYKSLGIVKEGDKVVFTDIVNENCMYIPELKGWSKTSYYNLGPAIDYAE